MEDLKITVKDIEDFLKDRYERFASKIAKHEGYLGKIVFMDVCGIQKQARVYFYEQGEPVDIFDGVLFEYAVEMWNKL